MRRTYKARGDALVRSEAGEQGFWQRESRASGRRTPT